MSITIQQNIDLKPLNTFGMMAFGKQCTIIEHPRQLEDVCTENLHAALPYFILGGGSNILLLDDVQAWILKNECKGIQTIKEDEDHVWLEVGGGETWHEFVLYCVAHDYAGVENLALIPGTVGAAPIQNIGAYGVEVKDVIELVHTYHLQDQIYKSYQNEECEFAYRDSIFKRLYKNKIFIYSVVFKLNKHSNYQISYGAISDTLQQLNLETTTANIAQAVISIRQSKLPDPKQIGNSGSFFKNPEISTSYYAQLKAQYADLPGYIINDDVVKVPAGWLIERAGWKGYKNNNFGVHPQQALVLVNYGGATGQEIYNLSETIIKDIQLKFGLELEREVQVYPSVNNNITNQ